MKQRISILLAVFIFASCTNKTPTEKEIVGISGAGIKNNNILTDTSRITKTTILPNGTTTTTITTTTKPVQISSGKNDVEVNKSATENTGNESVRKTQTSTIKTSTNTTSTNNDNNTNTKNKGWSDAAIGATAGGVGGSVLGAVVSKDKVKGAIIGGVIGGGTGYLIGRSRDRKSGRVKKKHTTQNN